MITQRKIFFLIESLLLAILIIPGISRALSEEEARTGEVIVTTPAIIDFETLRKPDIASNIMYFHQRGVVEGAPWRLEASVPWVVIERTEGRFQKGAPTPVKLTLDSRKLKRGSHLAHIIITVGDDEERHVPLVVFIDDGLPPKSLVAIESVLLNPLRISIVEGQSRRLSATAVWSDGRRSDVSSSQEGRWVNSNPSVASFDGRSGLLRALSPGIAEIKRIERATESVVARIEVTEIDRRLRLQVTPREVDLGIIGPDESSKGLFQVKRIGAGNINCTLHVARQWNIKGWQEPLSLLMAQEERHLGISLRSVADRQRKNDEGKRLFYLELTLELGKQRVIYQRQVPEGLYRDTLQVLFDDRYRTLFFIYRVSDEKSRPILDVEPRELSLGVLEPGKVYMSEIHVSNSGRSTLTWNAETRGRRASSSGEGNLIRLSPARGSTSTARDFVNVMINPAGQEAGLYSENIIFYSNGGEEVVRLSFEVGKAPTSSFIPVYAYSNGETLALLSEKITGREEVVHGYRRQGVAFTLFSAGTPGTAEFYVWHNPDRTSWFYTTDRMGDGLEDIGYVFNGSMGNIALVPLPHTSELYRFYNPEARLYLYRTSLRETDRQRRKGYRYDGIAGYVR